MNRACGVCVALLIAVSVAGCAGEQLHREGLEAVDRGDYEEGLTKLQAALTGEPDNMTYRSDLKARHEAVVLNLIGRADGARASGMLDEAVRNYERVLKIEPGNQRAARGLDRVKLDRRHAEVIVAARENMTNKDFDHAEAKVRAVLAEDPGFPSAKRLMEEINTARGPIAISPRLHSPDNRPVTLQFREANTKMVFEALARQTGINFIFDKDVRADSKTTLFVQNVPIEQAIDLILGQNQLARQILSENMVLIYPNTAQKQKEYQDQIVKVFYLTNAAPKDAESMLKTVLNAKTLYVDERTKMITMRDTPESIRMAEKLVASIDLPEAEVMLEVEVLEIDRSRLQQLGIKYPDTATIAATSLSGGSGLVLSDIGKQNSDSLTITPLSVTIDAMKQKGVSNLLASPRIRARNKEKARILIGAREPVLTNSVTPTSSGTQVVTGTVQYLDVGLTLEVEPTIYLDSDVAIKVNLEVSSILKAVVNPVSGTTAYEIGTRNASTLLQLKDGETQILAGLIQDLDSHSSAEIPGLGDIPVIGRLFGSRHSDTEKTEIVLSITPRIVRSQPRPSSESTEFWYGTETTTRSAPLGFSQTGAAAQGAAVVVAPSATSEGGPVPLAAPVTAVPAAGVPAPAVATVEHPPISSIRKPEASGAPTLSLEGPTEVKVGEEFEVTMRMQNAQALRTVRGQLRFDAGALQLVRADPGEVSGDPGSPPKVDERPGGAQIELKGSPDNPITGDGSLMTLHFRAIATRPASQVAGQLAVVGADGTAVGASLPATLTLAVTK
jgi:general secretion pathway protein D